MDWKGRDDDDDDDLGCAVGRGRVTRVGLGGFVKEDKSGAVNFLAGLR